MLLCAYKLQSFAGTFIFWDIYFDASYTTLLILSVHVLDILFPIVSFQQVQGAHW